MLESVIDADNHLAGNTIDGRGDRGDNDGVDQADNILAAQDQQTPIQFILWIPSERSQLTCVLQVPR